MTVHDSSLVEMAAAVKSREISAVELVQGFQERIQALEPTIKAWVTFEPEKALNDAKRVDDDIAAGRDPGPLAGIPFGVKDVFDASGYPTRCGAYPEREPAARDSFAVARLRDSGAVVMGKTVTTAFAFVDPSISRNPKNPARTPGGSSAGSGASVGGNSIPFALGTQTAGSTLRPAAYCGAVGFKPTYGRIGRSGITPLAMSLDHAGVICRSVADAAALIDVMSGFDPADPASRAFGPVNASATVQNGENGPAPRLAVLTEAFDRSSGPMATRIREVADAARREGAVVEDVSLPLDLLLAVQRVVMLSEASSAHRDLTTNHPELNVPRLRAVVRAGSLIPAEVYLRADRLRRRLAVEVDLLLRRYDAIFLPSVTSTAPTPETTGDPSLQAPWTLLGIPSISLPAGADSDGLPFAMQLVGADGEDAALLRTARWMEKRFSL